MKHETRDYTAYLARKRAEFGKKFDPSDLNPLFVKYYENQQRITVDFGYEKNAALSELRPDGNRAFC